MQKWFVVYQVRTTRQDLVCVDHYVQTDVKTVSNRRHADADALPSVTVNVKH
jgi:hypothetical protein